MKFMKSVYSRPLLALIFATSAIFVTSAEASAFVSSSVAERADGALPSEAAISGKPGSSPTETAIQLANLKVSEKIDENEDNEDKREVLGKEIGITDGIFQKSGVATVSPT